MRKVYRWKTMNGNGSFSPMACKSCVKFALKMFKELSLAAPA